GIRVNAVAPGWVRVGSQEGILGEQFDWQRAGESLPAAFVGAPEDIAEAVLFLADEASRFLVGQTVIVDGGQLAMMPAIGSILQPNQARFGRGYISGSSDD
ncbi:MAG: SDR family oxidoreductase, partial [Vicinamibacteraceae bacterium]